MTATERVIEPQSLRDRQRSLARFGQRALQGLPLDDLLHQACAEAAAGVGVPMAKVAMRQEHSDELLLTGAVGIPEFVAIPGRTTIPGGHGSAIGYALEVRAPVLSDVEHETRFDPSELVRRMGVKCSLNLVIWADGAPFGCLEVDSKEPCAFTESDIDFVQLYANLVGAAVERHRLTQRAAQLAHDREVLIDELAHRVKNMLTNVLAVAHRTRRHSRTLDQFGAAFEGRVSAMGRAQDLLIAKPEQAVSLRELLWLELDAKGMQEGVQFTLDGTDVLCSPRTIQILALVVHELATNAVKYGALSPHAADGARVNIDWTVEPARDVECLSLRWRETGFRLEPAPRRRGFGSEMIDNLVPQMLGGSTRLHCHADGIECVIRFPLVEQRGRGTARGV